jgi:RND family efflux transporter MFP subunit
MKRKVKLGLIVGVVIVLALVAAGALRKRANGAPTPVATPATVPAKQAGVIEFLPGDIVPAQTRDLRASLPLSGNLRAWNQAAVKSKVSGEVRALPVREGEAVKAGQVVARIDPTEYEARVAQARGQMLAAKGQYDNALQILSRNRDLVAKGFLSKTAFENYQSNVDVAKANYEAANGGLAVAQKQLADTVLRAPLSGLVAVRAVQPGEKVAPDTKLLDIVDLSVLELEAPVPMADVGRLTIGQEVLLDIEGDGTVTGKLERINPAATQGSRSIMIYVRIPNADHRVRAGMFAQGGLTLERKAGVLAVPASAVRTEGERRFVYAIENGKLAEKQVQTGVRSDEAGGLVEITSGLAADARIVKNNLGTLRVGAPVVMAGSGT